MLQKVKNVEVENQKLKNKNMSKYNLTDIFEEMSTSEKERFDRLSKDDQDKLEKIMAMVAKEKSMKEDKYDDIVDADDDIPADKKKAAAAAYRKVDKGASYEKATSHIKEVRIEREVASRIEGLLNIQLKKQFLDVFEDLWLDLIEEDPFYVEDVIAHLSNEMYKQISNRQAQGDRLAGLEEDEAMSDTEAKLEAGEIGTHLAEEDSIEEALPKFKGVPPMKDIVKALKNDAKATDSEIKQFMTSVKKAGDEFDDVDDYVEDFKNYVADKSLQEHFGRFMKDYQ